LRNKVNWIEFFGANSPEMNGGNYTIHSMTYQMAHISMTVRPNEPEGYFCCYD